MKKINIAIDGYSGTGKSSTAKKVADALGYIYVDTGAMYRASTYYLLQHNVNTDSAEEIIQHISDIDLRFVNNRICLNGQDVEDQIREPSVSREVSKISATPELRARLVALQQQIGEEKGVVMDGRDIGTAVFPWAELKIFMTADVGIRAVRRQKELVEKGIDESLEAIEANLRERDELDSSRKVSPLRKASDAHEIDTSGLTLKDQVEKIVLMAKEIIYAD